MKELSYWLAYFAYLILIRKEIPTTYRTRAIINRGFLFLPHFSLQFYIVEWLVLQTIYVLNKKILQFLGLKSKVNHCQRFQIKNGL